MRNLLCADFSRLWRSKLFYGGVLLLMLNSVYALINNCYYKNLWAISDITPDGILLISTSLLPLAIAAFMAFFVGTERGDRTLCNKITAGYSRTAIYFSYLAVCGTAALLMHLLGMVPVLLFGAPLLGAFRHLPMLLPQVLCSLLSTLGFVALFLVPAVLLDHKALGVIVLLLLAIFLSYYVPEALTILLEEPPYLSVFEIDESGELTVLPDHTQPNPKYLAGPARAAVQLLFDLLPCGQMYQYGSYESPQNLALFPLYTLLFCAACTLGGCVLLRRKNFK